MSYKMIIEWRFDDITPEMSELVLSKISTMISEGKTDGSQTRQYNPLGFVATRTFRDLPAAQEFEAFEMQLPNKPRSIVIEPA